MANSSVAKNDLAGRAGAQATYISVATASPGTAGTISNEPAITRQQTTWGSASGGVITGSQVTLTSVPAGTYTHVILATASTGSTVMYDNYALGTPITLSVTGSISITPTYTVS